jgi:membrane-bound metal-dependent hydrolase YbcI (DUF457 family)
VDPITHGFAGALLGESWFADRYGRAAVFAVTLGAVFPDVDVVMDFVIKDPLSVVKYHRAFTHSFIGLPLFATVLAALTAWLLSRLKWKSPGFGILMLAYAVGIASHILLDEITSFGTQAWAPLNHTRVAWDLLFIVDFLFSTILLLPQLAAWAYADSRRTPWRAACVWLGFCASTLGVFRIAAWAGFPFYLTSAFVLMAVFGAVLFIPLPGGWGWEWHRSQWCRAGLFAACVYLLVCFAAHHAAMERVDAFVKTRGVHALRTAAIPLPPNLLAWDGLVLTEEGVYRARFHLWDTSTPNWQFFASSASNAILGQALRLPEVQTYLWFARFPVIHTAEQDGLHIAEFLDLRFSVRRQGQEPPFTFRVEMNPEGQMIEEDWLVGASGMHLKRVHPAGGTGSE